MSNYGGREDDNVWKIIIWFPRSIYDMKSE
jgi:hypothetical protein